MERQGPGSVGAELRVVRNAVRRATPLLAALVVLQLLALATWTFPGTLCPSLLGRWIPAPQNSTSTSLLEASAGVGTLSTSLPEDSDEAKGASAGVGTASKSLAEDSDEAKGARESPFGGRDLIVQGNLIVKGDLSIQGDLGCKGAVALRASAVGGIAGAQSGESGQSGPSLGSQHSGTELETQERESSVSGAGAGAGAMPGARSGEGDGGGRTGDAAASVLQQTVDRISGPERRVILAGATSNFLDFLMNWYISVAKIGHGGRVLFIAEDQGAYDYLLDKFPSQVVKGSDVVGDWSLPQQEHKTDFNSAFFNTLVDRRPAYFRALAEANVSFLYSDVDIVFLKDPFPFFKGDYDLWVQEDTQTFEGAKTRFPEDEPGSMIRLKRHHLCTCFMYLHPTVASKILIERWDRSIKRHLAQGGKGAVTNQGEFNRVLYATLDSDVSLGVLPTARFPSGCVFFPWPDPAVHQGLGGCNKDQRGKFLRNFPEWKSNIVMVHNNWVVGRENKVKRFKEANLWFVGGQSG